MSVLDGDEGVVGGAEVLPFGLVIFVSFTLLIVNMWAVVDAKMAMISAAQQTARTFVESPQGSAHAAARLAGGAAIEAHGRDPELATIDIPAGPKVRCEPVTVSASYQVPALTLPFIGSFGTGPISVSASHTEIVDPFRSGLDAGGGCAEFFPR